MKAIFKKNSISKTILKEISKKFSPLAENEISNLNNGLIDYDNLETYVKLLVQGFLNHVIDKYSLRFKISNWDVYFKQQNYTELFTMLFSGAVAYTKTEKNSKNFIIFPLYIINTYNSQMRFNNLNYYNLQGIGYINKYLINSYIDNNKISTENNSDIRKANIKNGTGFLNFILVDPVNFNSKNTIEILKNDSEYLKKMPFFFNSPNQIPPFSKIGSLLVELGQVYKLLKANRVNKNIFATYQPKNNKQKKTTHKDFTNTVLTSENGIMIFSNNVDTDNLEANKKAPDLYNSLNFEKTNLETEIYKRCNILSGNDNSKSSAQENNDQTNATDLIVANNADAELIILRKWVKNFNANHGIKDKFLSIELSKHIKEIIKKSKIDENEKDKTT